MQYTLNDNLFFQTLKFIVDNNQNPDADRCNIINVNVDKEYQLTLCLNEKTKCIKLCNVTDDNGNEIIKSEVIKCCFDELMNIVMNTKNEKESELYVFYKEKIQPAIECCELNQ